MFICLKSLNYHTSDNNSRNKKKQNKTNNCPKLKKKICNIYKYIKEYIYSISIWRFGCIFSQNFKIKVWLCFLCEVGCLHFMCSSTNYLDWSATPNMSKFVVNLLLKSTQISVIISWRWARWFNNHTFKASMKLYFEGRFFPYFSFPSKM